jgi:hypothetical protein
MQTNTLLNNKFKIVGGVALGYVIYKSMKLKKEGKQISKADAFIGTIGLFSLMIGFIGLNKA